MRRYLLLVSLLATLALSANNTIPNLPYYWQYANTHYPATTCGNTTLAMSLRAYGASDAWTPDHIYEKYDNYQGIWNSDDDNFATNFNKIAKYINANESSTINVTATLYWLMKSTRQQEFQTWRADLDAGKVVAVKGHFTSSTHILLLVGYDANNYIVHDPAGKWVESRNGGYYNQGQAGQETAGKYIAYPRSAFESAVDNGDWYVRFSGPVNSGDEKLCYAYTPEAGATVTKEKVTFTFGNNYEADTYRLKVSTNANATWTAAGGFTSTSDHVLNVSNAQEGVVVVDNANGKYENFSVTPGATYYWTVKAWNSSTNTSSDYTPVRSFTVPMACTAIAPEDGERLSISNEVNFKFCNNAEATAYRLMVTTNPNAAWTAAGGFTSSDDQLFAGGVGFTSSDTDREWTWNASTTGDGGAALADPQPGTTYYWTVKAWSQKYSKNLDYTPVQSFTTPIICTAKAPVQNQLVESASKVDFTFGNDGEATMYRIQVSTSPDGWNKNEGFIDGNSVNDVVQVNTGLTTDAVNGTWSWDKNSVATYAAPKPGATYYWSVRCFKSGYGNSEWTEPEAFTTPESSTEIITCQAIRPVPEEGEEYYLVFDRPVNFYFSNDGEALTYQLQVVKPDDTDSWTPGNGFSPTQQPTSSVIVNATVTSDDPEEGTWDWNPQSEWAYCAPQNGETYYWTVRAIKTDGDEPIFSDYTYPQPFIISDDAYMGIWSRATATTYGEDGMGATLLQRERPSWFLDNDAQRGIAYTGGLVFVASNENGPDVKVLNAYNGNDVEFATGDSSLNMTGVTGTLGDVETDNSCNIFACTIAEAGEDFTIYTWPYGGMRKAPSTYLTYTVPTGMKLGDTFTVRGSVQGNAVIFVPDQLSNKVLRWDVTNGTLSATPTVVELADASLGSNQSIAPLSDTATTDFFASGNSGAISRYSADGSLIGSISTKVIPAAETSQVEAFTQGSKQYLAVYQSNGASATTQQYTYVVEVPVTGSPASVTEDNVYGLTPSLGEDENANSTGDVTVCATDDDIIVFTIATNSGVAANRATDFVSTVPVYEDADDFQQAVITGVEDLIADVDIDCRYDDGSLYITGVEPGQSVVLTVADLSGRLVANRTLIGNGSKLTTDLPNLTNGIYLISMHVKSCQIHRKIQIHR